MELKDAQTPHRCAELFHQRKPKLKLFHIYHKTRLENGMAEKKKDEFCNP